jgi:lipopolysaccharide export system permease protein
MRRIETYLLRQMFWPSFAAASALTGLAVLSQMLTTLNILVDQRQSTLTFLKIVALSLPSTAVITLPIALFVACLVALNRLHTEQEIVVCFAGGMSRWRVSAPAVRLAVAAALLTLVVNLWVQPWATRRMREELFAIRTDLVTTLVQQGEFNEPAKGLTVYAQTADGAGDLTNVYIYQDKDGGRSATFAAKNGLITKQGGKPVLILRDGSQQQFNNRDILNYLKFDDYVFDLAPYVNTTEEVHYKISDRYLHELVYPDKRQDWERNNRKKMLAEANARLTSPLYNITFVILALNAVVGGAFSRLGYARRIAWTAAAAAALRILGFAAQAACDSTPALNVLQWIVPLLPAIWIGRRLFVEGGHRAVQSLAHDGRLQPLGA